VTRAAVSRGSFIPDRVAAPMPSWRVPIEARSEEMYPLPLAGTVEVHRLESRVLKGNPWEDPADRDLPVYLPPSGTTKGLPLLVMLSGYTGTGGENFQRGLFLRDSLGGRLDRLIRTRRAPEAVMVSPNCITTLGGSQYLNSSATGRYEDYVVDEVVPWVRRKYGTGPTAVLGTSSGGYGAMVLALRHPDLFSALATDAGDAYFEYCYPPDFPPAFRELRAAGGPEPFLREMFRHPVDGFGPAHPKAQAISTLAYASCYSPIESEPGRFDVPFDLETGALREDVWARWLAWDPVRMVARPPYVEAARKLATVYVCGGRKDEFGLDVSARIFAEAARRQGAKVEFEEFDGGHFDKAPRYDTIYVRLLTALGFPPPSRL
jgi:pimeloyl-ACP methyl ester carboxylesterase